MKSRVLGAVLAAAAACAGRAAACPVCYGNSDAPVVHGAELSVMFMGLLTYALILGGAATFLVLRRRALRQVGPPVTS